jgi:hypothetical protein
MCQKARGRKRIEEGKKEGLKKKVAGKEEEPFQCFKHRNV